jgi:hypothetical protein
VRGFQPFVVMGSAKSGTTWVQRILDSHPAVRCHFQQPVLPLLDKELWTPRIKVYNGNQTPFEGVFDQRLDELAYASRSEYLQSYEPLRERAYVQRFVEGLDEARASELRALHRRILARIVEEALCDTPGALRVGSKAYTDLKLLFEVFPGAKVIHILRDGRDVAVSKRFHLYRSRSFFLGDERSRWLTRLHSWSRTRHLVFRLRKRFGWFGEDAFWSPDSGRPFFHRRILEMLAGDWRRIVDYLLAREAESPERFLTVRYEELLADPELWIGRLLEFLDVARDPETVGKIAEATSFRSMSKGKAGFFRGGRSGDWRDKFTAADHEQFLAIAGRTLEAAGYPLEGP